MKRNVMKATAMLAMESATRGKTAALFGAPLPAAAAAVMTNKKPKKGKQGTQQQQQHKQKQRRPNGKFCLISAPLKV